MAPGPASDSADNTLVVAAAELTAADRAREAVLGPELYARVRGARLLVVGAGGIGCELLKDLVMAGFEDLEVVDLDTIDVSNLNRQFLFRAHHVGQPKAVVAREAVLAFNPRARIVAHHDNIKNPKFGLEYYKGFTMVLNALDNIDARRHVNKLCLATDRPMIDAGTTGYVGQATVVRKGQAACYECEEKAAQKVYPICTIRATPDKPVHCVVWAKEAYRLLFGQRDASMLYEAPDAPEPSLYMPVVAQGCPVPFDGNGENSSGSDIKACSLDDALAYGGRVLKVLFHDELAARVAKGLYKGAAKTPTPVAALASDAQVAALVQQATAQAAAAKGKGTEEEEEEAEGWTRAVWDAERCALEVLKCVAALLADPERAKGLGAYAFDKDDPWAMRFVTAAANLRAAGFGIPPQSYHDAKGIAGNIVPAIATTNAMAAGLQVLEALKILRAGAHTEQATLTDAGCKVTYIVRGFAGRKRLLLQPSALHPPNPGCFVCNTEGLDVAVDTRAMTLAAFVAKVLKGGALPFISPSVCLNGGGDIVYEEGEDADEELAARNGPKALAALPCGGITHGAVVRVDDAAQELTLDLRIEHREWAEDDPDAPPDGFKLLGKSLQRSLDAAKSAGEAQARLRAEQQERHAAEEAVTATLRVGAAVAGSSSSKKRPAADEGEGPAGGSSEEEGAAGAGAGGGQKQQAKKARTTAAADAGDDAICILDDDEEAAAAAATNGNGKAKGAGANAADDEVEMVVVE